jgi:hypothetical protein
MMAKDHPFIGDQKIASVFEPLGRSGPQAIERQDFYRDKTAVEAVSEGIAAGRRHYQPHGVNRLAASNGNHRHCGRAEQGDRAPNKNG